MQGGGEFYMVYFGPMASTLHIHFASLQSATVIVGRAADLWVASPLRPVLAVRRIGVLQEGSFLLGFVTFRAFLQNSWGGVIQLVYALTSATPSPRRYLSFSVFGVSITTPPSRRHPQQRKNQ